MVAAVAATGGLDDNEVVGAMVMGVQALSALRRPGASGLVAIASQPESVTIRIDKALLVRVTTPIVIQNHLCAGATTSDLVGEFVVYEKEDLKVTATPTPSEVAIGREEADAEKKQTLVE